MYSELSYLIGIGIQFGIMGVGSDYIVMWQRRVKFTAFLKATILVSI